MPIQTRHANLSKRRVTIEDDTPIAPNERKKTKKRELNKEFNQKLSNNGNARVISADRPTSHGNKKSRRTNRSFTSKGIHDKVDKPNEGNLTKAMIKVESQLMENNDHCICEDQNVKEDIPSTVCDNSTSTSHGNGGISIISEKNPQDISSMAPVVETTIVEEDYQRKYFQLLNAMNDLQEKFFISQNDFEDLVEARETFIGELKNQLCKNNEEMASIEQKWKSCNKMIEELEKEKLQYEDHLKNYSMKVEMMKCKETEVKNQTARCEELQQTIVKQQEELDFYNLLCGVKIEKISDNEDSSNSAVYKKLQCTMKTSSEAKDIQFILSYDSEFAEVEYTPLKLDSIDSSFPDYLHEQIWFESDQAPNFLRRLLQALYKSDAK